MSTNIFDYSYTSIERIAFAGRLYRMGTGYVTLTTSGSYASICFQTPPALQSLYRFASVEKSGNEVGVELIEDCTYSGGNTVTPWNLNRNFRDFASPLVNTRTGNSVTGTVLTISGGTTSPLRMVPGANNPSAKPGGGSESSGYIPLRPDTKYALKLTALSGEVTLTAINEVACLVKETTLSVPSNVYNMMLVNQDNTNGGGWFNASITTSGISSAYLVPVMPVRDIAVTVSGFGFVGFTSSPPTAIADGSALYEYWDGLSQINPAVTGFRVVSTSGLVTANILVKTAYAS